MVRSGESSLSDAMFGKSHLGNGMFGRRVSQVLRMR
jgi:hypothetical protein